MSKPTAARLGKSTPWRPGFAAGDRFLASLPRRPQCADGLAAKSRDEPFYTVTRNVGHAIRFSHIQPNLGWSTQHIAIDIDRPDAAFTWEVANMPPPSVIIQNPRNLHAHAVYSLATPILLGSNSRLKPAQFGAAVERGLRRRLNGDPGYSGHLIKNPFHGHWRTSWPACSPYGLDQLAGWMSQDDMRLELRGTGTGWIGRNVSLFDACRHWAYGEVTTARRRGNFETWQRCVLSHAMELNATINTPPLGVSEVRATARSIAKWTWRVFGSTGGPSAAFSDRQSHRAKRSAAIRTDKASARRELIRHHLSSLTTDTTYGCGSVASASAAGASLPTPVGASGSPPGGGRLSDMANFRPPTAEELAARFGVTARTIRSDLQALRSEVA